MKIKMLTNVSSFAGVDGKNYKLNQGEVTLLPELNAKALWKRKLGVLMVDKISARLE